MNHNDYDTKMVTQNAVTPCDEYVKEEFTTPPPERVGGGMVLVRTGKCDPVKCGSACCKFYMITGGKNVDDYTSGFFENKNIYDDFYEVKNCKHLDVENNKCKVWDSLEFPKVCAQFPNYTDPVYRHVFKECSFRFTVEPEKPIKKQKSE